MATSKEQHDAQQARTGATNAGMEPHVGHTPRGTERGQSQPQPQGIDPARAAGGGPPSRRAEQQGDGQPENEQEIGQRDRGPSSRDATASDRGTGAGDGGLVGK